MAIVDGHIRCTGCGEPKPLDAFAPAVSRRGHGECRACKNARNRDYESRNRDKVRARSRAWNEANRDKVRKRGLAAYYRNHEKRKAEARAAYRRPEVKAAKHFAHTERRFGITGVEYEALLSAQGHACALCRKPPPTMRRLAVDHDHQTGRVRGLLCTNCNTALGHLGDTAEGLRHALNYVERAQQPHAGATPAIRINLLQGAN